MSADDLEKGGAQRMEHLQRQITAGGHIADTSQPILPVFHRKLANPTPLGLLSFATGIFFISCIGVHARGVTIGNMLIAVMIFYGGTCQFSKSEICRMYSAVNLGERHC
jgi:succinate-acetate transporter protein